MTEKSEKSTASKAGTPAVKPATTVLKSVTAKPVVANAIKPEEKNKKTKIADDKVIRVSFNMPQSDYEKIIELKRLCLKAGVKVKKSELVRVGLHALSVLSAAQLKKAVTQIAPVKAENPKKPGKVA